MQVTCPHPLAVEFGQRRATRERSGITLPGQATTDIRTHLNLSNLKIGARLQGALIIVVALFAASQSQCRQGTAGGHARRRGTG